MLSLPVSAQSPLEHQDMEISVKLSNILELKETGNNYEVEKVKATLSWIPRDSYRQTVRSITTEPEAELQGDDYVFQWVYPSEKELWIQLNGQVETTADYYPVRKKVDFPIMELDPELSEYLAERDIIDFNPAIRNKAAELAEGRDDLYEVVIEIAEWVNENIDYSLDTLTAEASQKSSWVLANRRGVCDEMTSLFISMLRSLGIPARFVYGESYTNLQDDNWGSHGWAEVYFPEVGWVPFDPTYGEYGYLDAGHVKMGYSLDARKPSLRYTSKSTDARLTSGYLDIDADVVRSGAKLKDEFRLTADTHYAETGYNAYNLVTAEITNPDDIYKPVVLKINEPAEIKVEDESPRLLLLKPGETRKVHWIVKTGQLQNQYIYTFPISIYTDKNQAVNVTYKAQQRSPQYGKELLEALVDSEDVSFTYNEKVLLECEADRETMYAGESATVTCSFENNGEKDIKGELCHDECIDFQNEIIKEYSVSYDTPGVKNIIVRATGQDFSKTSYVRMNVIDESDIDINLDIPETAEYGERMNIKFNITKDSISTPRNLQVRLHFQKTYQQWEIDSLDRPNQFDVGIDTDGFTFNNEFRITVTYEDDVGKKYREEAMAEVELVNLSIRDKVFVGLNSFGYWLIRLADNI